MSTAITPAAFAQTGVQPSTTPAAAAHNQPESGQAPYSDADIRFFTGMISHHSQAVLMAGWAPSHGASASLQGLCERIVVAQRDEIAVMQRWLRERHLPVPDPDPRGMAMPGMAPMLMPGMLTPEQMAQLDAARGVQFDRLFLQFMIQHHLGAISMVETLLGSTGAAQDGLVFRFASDVNADQTTEIDRMRRMLAALPLSGGSQ
ncbi:MAG TPA: DUF305 domain-containing protein [Gemmatimonadales bacterium]